ncbi:polyphosphate kinase 2 [Chthonobacter albigriseus]|uniref:polyphosphate kinase 2 n=1 Tax=Chthonobacter albigriseus TaxID=1683161 RepID=UPI0015EE88A4|nr:polyphosphate kinase 2 [Chthonobacter albigriseus]
MAKKSKKGRDTDAEGGASTEAKGADKGTAPSAADLLAEREGKVVLDAQAPQAPAIRVGTIDFDLDEPELPPLVEARALSSGGYPYAESTKSKVYDEQLRLLQIELVKLQKWVGDTGARIVALFEGRDAAGKGGTVATFRAYMNPRSARAVALPKPNEVERGQWYFQRYSEQLPTKGEIVLFDRSWYNRGVVERVMGFCTEAESDAFLEEVPRFEKMLVNDGIVLVKFWLDIGREMQLKRFHDRRHDPLKIWKLSPIDIKALGMWDEYTVARDRMLKASHTKHAPWTIILANDKKRARLNAIRHLLAQVDYAGKSAETIGETDPRILKSSLSLIGLK